MSGSLYYEMAENSCELLVNIENVSKIKGDTLPALQAQFLQFLSKRKLKPYQSSAKVPDWVLRAKTHNDLATGTKSRKHSDEMDDEFEKSDSLIGEYANQWVEAEAVRDLAMLSAKAAWNYYLNTEDFLHDLTFLVQATLKRCSNALAKEYVTELHLFAYQLCKYCRATFLSQVELDFHEFYKGVVAVERLQVAGTWSKKAMPRRQYFQVNEFIPGMKGDSEVLERLKTKLHGDCDGKHCLTYESLGPLSLADETWLSECGDRKRKVECNREVCGCKSMKCMNRSITDGETKKMGVHVQEIESWGVDYFTIKLIIAIMPKNISSEVSGKFIEEALNKAFQSQGKVGWDIRNSLNFIISNAEQFESLHVRMARHLLQIVELNRRGIDSFKVHSKGIGVICLSSAGFKQNELINEYFGEIYPPWRWYEKQDIIKKGQNEGKISQDLPDFYNITLEKHRYDPDGYDVLVLSFVAVVCGSDKQRRLLQQVQSLLQSELLDGGDGGCREVHNWNVRAKKHRIWRGTHFRLQLRTSFPNASSPTTKANVCLPFVCAEAATAAECILV
eukprot:TRINITY_DN5443_c0_g1_i11.p1 TRINITY_DN5443_c0_g1~~TRINITY_DN5443_c0_g1_i11.p1  ORF type:complete len:561 (+),score=118.46 TRINITY_DN5443_c0_g1_i11:303-1985(+)